MVRDALVHHFARHREEYARDPVAYELRELSNDPEAAAEMEARRAALVANPLWHRTIERLREGVDAPAEPPVQNRTLKVRTNLAMGPPKRP